MKQSTYFRFRCTEYEREVIRQLKDTTTTHGVSTLSESDIVRLAIMEFAAKHLSADKLADIKKDFE